MPELIKYTLEFPIHSSVNILFIRISTASGLSEWFADDVIIKNKIYTFIWGGYKQEAKLIKIKKNHLICFKWIEDDDNEKYFEFKIIRDEITSDVALFITDFAEDEDEKQEQSDLWKKQINNLKRTIGLK